MATDLALVVVGIGALLSTAAWLRVRRLLTMCRSELECQSKTSQVLDVERRIMVMMGSGASLKEVLDVLTLAIEEIAHECRCSILLLDDQRQHLMAGSGGSLPSEYMSAVNGLSIGPDVGACGSAAFRNQTIVVEDVATDYRFAMVKDFLMSFGLRACWSVPIRDSLNRVSGTFAMYHHYPVKPKERELKIVEAAAHVAGTAIERLRAAEKILENEQRIKLAQKAASLGIWDVDFQSGTVTLSEELAHQAGFPRAAARLEINQLSSVIQKDDWQNVRAAAERARANGELFSAEFRVPLPNGVVRWLRAEGRMCSESGVPRRLTGASIDITREKEMVARQLERARELEAEKGMVEAVKDVMTFRASHDALTELWNRAAILESMTQQIAARQGKKSDFALLLVDIDHFKRINDTYGHLVGDQVLKRVAKRMTASVRANDQVGRYGGEEFLVILPDCSRKQALALAERIREIIANRPFEIDELQLFVTVSIGTTNVEEAICQGTDLIAAADNALYRAKRNGRNRVEWRSSGSAVICA